MTELFTNSIHLLSVLLREDLNRDSNNAALSGHRMGCCERDSQIEHCSSITLILRFDNIFDQTTPEPMTKSATPVLITTAETSSLVDRALQGEAPGLKHLSGQRNDGIEAGLSS